MGNKYFIDFCQFLTTIIISLQNPSSFLEFLWALFFNRKNLYRFFSIFYIHTYPYILYNRTYWALINSPNGKTFHQLLTTLLIESEKLKVFFNTVESSYLFSQQSSTVFVNLLQPDLSCHKNQPFFYQFLTTQLVGNLLVHKTSTIFISLFATSLVKSRKTTSFDKFLTTIFISSANISTLF